jgi:hypothetical protein
MTSPPVIPEPAPRPGAVWPQRATLVRTGSGEPDWAPAAGWPAGRPIAQWPRLAAGRPDDLRG